VHFVIGSLDRRSGEFRLCLETDGSVAKSPGAKGLITLPAVSVASEGVSSAVGIYRSMNRSAGLYGRIRLQSGPVDRQSISCPSELPPRIQTEQQSGMGCRDQENLPKERCRRTAPRAENPVPFISSSKVALRRYGSRLSVYRVSNPLSPPTVAAFVPGICSSMISAASRSAVPLA